MSLCFVLVFTPTGSSIRQFLSNHASQTSLTSAFGNPTPWRRSTEATSTQSPVQGGVSMCVVETTKTYYLPDMYAAIRASAACKSALFWGPIMAIHMLLLACPLADIPLE